MSYSRGNGQNGGHFYSNITQPVKIDCNFVVDPANGNGLGVRSIKSNGYVQNVFMHTSSTPGVGNGGLVNPNPQPGTIMVQFKNNYNYYLGGFSGAVSPLSGTPVTSTTTGLVYVIVSLGTTTIAQWQAAGVIVGQTPAVGLAFVAKATGAIGGTGAVEVPATAGSGITNFEVEGDAHLSINSSIAANAGLVVIVNAYASGVLTAPAIGTTLGMSFFFDASSVGIPDGGPSNTPPFIGGL
jgi:hypothetical protein